MPDKGMIGKIIENYRLELVLGQGGMAAVYKATDIKLQRQVAIKIMHPHLASQTSFQQRFLQEARAAAHLDHPNIVRVLSFNNTENNLFLVMELIIGGNLRQYVKRLHEDNKFVDYQEAIEIIRQLADGVDYAHRQGMIHRDLKPDNVILKPDPDGERLNYRPIVTDFGLAKLTSSGENAITDQQPIGTYPYMSPEQCLAENVDNRSDIYALGIMLYELAVGRLPYHPKNIAEAARMHAREPLTLPSAVQANFPPELEQIIVKSLAKDPNLRYQSARELLEALAALQKPVERKPVQQVVVVKSAASTNLEDTFSTDLSTAQMATQLPTVIDEDIPRADDDEPILFDRLVFYNRDLPTFTANFDKPVITIGRAPNRTVVLQGTLASRNHVQVERKPNGRYYITDMNSTNGVWLGSERLAPDSPVILNPGVTVRLGDYWMQLLLKPDVVQAAAPSIDDAAFDTNPEGDAAPALPPPPRDTHIFDDEIVTMGFDFPPKEKPRYTPPYLTADQMAYDRLVFYSEDEPTLTVKLDKDHLSIGRAKNRDIVLEGLGISRRHARIERMQDGAFYLTDLGSVNGITINDKHIPTNSPIRLTPEQTIRIGTYWMEYEPRRELPADAVLPLPSKLETSEFDLDAYATVVMPKPLPPEMPAFSPPPLSMEMRTADRLILYSEEHPIQMVKIDSEIIDIGRDDDQNIVLDGKRVSRRHARVEAKSDGNLYITDLNATNGTWVGDTLLVPNTQVQWEPDEIVRMGHYWMKFERGSRELDVFQGPEQKDSRGLVGKRIKNYRIDRFIGQNSMTGVYKATELPLERAVALKVMHPNLASQDALKQRFLQESRMLSRLDHPNIVHVLSYDNVDNELFMVMELITGISLRQYMNRLREQNKQVDLSEVVSLTVQLADGMHYAHQQGMIHRDLKPESVVLKTSAVIGPIVRYQPVLTDFTVAQQSATGEIFVTDKPDTDFPYMSPEQCLGERVDLRSDIYELGVLLYEMLIGRPPYQPRSIAEAVRMHAREPLQAPTDFREEIPDDLEKIVMRALEKNANNRYQTAGDLSRALQRTGVAISDEAGAGAARFTSAVVDNFATVLMPKPLSAFMPLVTRYPELGERTDVDRLVIYSDDFPTRVIPLDKNVFTIGRDPEMDIVLPSDKVSRRHLRLERGLNNTYRLLDLGSHNGTYVGNYKLIHNIGEIWEKSETLRIGNFWIRLEEAVDPDAGVYRRPRPAPVDGDFSTDGGAVAVVVPPPPPPPAELEKIGVSVNGTVLHVVPGSSTTLPIEITNRSDIVDHFRVEVVGLPPTWVTQPADTVYLLPSKRDTTSVTFHPPLNTTSSAGAHAFEVRVTARAQGITSPGVQGALEVQPFYNFISDLEPERLRGGRRTELLINNTGNTFATYTIQARDREQAVRFEMEGKQYTLAPGQSERITLRPVPKRRPWFGRPETYPFEITVSAVPQEQTLPQTQNGEVIVPARITGLMIGCMVLLLLLCIVATAIGLITAATNYSTNATATVVAASTFTSATATAMVEADTDGDGLSNIRETAIGTDPNLPDTDGDGLVDGEEVQVWRTNPLNRDTDGDSLIDGQEIKLGTDPLNRDTDGDGEPDNTDPYPLQRATPTPLPIPTIPGTSGDVCPGSPTPSQISVGIAGIVTEGGVANRVRSGPGKSNEIIGYMPPTTRFFVIGGPVCDPDDQIRWWEIDWNGLKGWTAEGEKDAYYLAPADGGGAGGTPAGMNVAPIVISDPPPMVAALKTDQMGIQLDWNVEDTGWRNVMTASKSLNMGWVKLQASWKALEPSRGQLGGEFAKLQAHVNEARASGYRVLLSIAKAPEWARTSRSEDGPPDDPAELARFISLLLAQIGPNVSAIEVWNEPNLMREWQGTLPFNGEGYMALFKPAYVAIRSYSASIIVISAGLAPADDTAVSVNDREYLRQMYRGGLANYDVRIGVHPFGWGNPPDVRCCNKIDGQGWDDKPQFFFLDTLADYRQIMLSYRHGAAKMWATEFGWGTWDGFSGAPPETWMAYNNTAHQAEYTVKAFQIGQALGFVENMFLWNLNFANPSSVGSGVEMAAYSLLMVDGAQNVSARASFDSFVSLRRQMQ
ncbi:MAG: protein kinase [Chloroflexi bacterium]|nr:protein kinase [Chloroflexota bacterium]MCC6894485.1 protein kinase [Anaerolineae bacterium]